MGGGGGFPCEPNGEFSSDMTRLPRRHRGSPQLSNIHKLGVPPCTPMSKSANSMQNLSLLTGAGYLSQVDSDGVCLVVMLHANGAIPASTVPGSRTLAMNRGCCEKSGAPGFPQAAPDHGEQILSWSIWGRGDELYISLGSKSFGFSLFSLHHVKIKHQSQSWGVHLEYALCGEVAVLNHEFPG